MKKDRQHNVKKDRQHNVKKKKDKWTNNDLQIITQKTKHLTRLSQPSDTPSSETRSVVTVELLFGEYSEHLAVCEGILQTDINWLRIILSVGIIPKWNIKIVEKSKIDTWHTYSWPLDRNELFNYLSYMTYINISTLILCIRGLFYLTIFDHFQFCFSSRK